MKIMGDGSIANLDKVSNSKCRHWRLKVITDQGIKTKRYTGTYTQAKEALDSFKKELSINYTDDDFEALATKSSSV